MPELTKSQLEQALTAVVEGLSEATSEDKQEHDFYAKIFPEGCSEIDLADAIVHVELHPLMVQVVAKIIDLISEGTAASIWIDSENQAGRYLSRALALYDKKYCALFAECLSCQDLTHEVHQNEDIDDIMRKWGLCDETGLILSAREENIGQCGQEYIEELIDEYGEALMEYLGAVNLDGDEELGSEEEVDWGVGYSVEVQDKNNRYLFLNWDKDSSLVLARHNAGLVKVIQYENPQGLQQAVKAFQESCQERNYRWKMETGTAWGDISGWAKPEPACDLLALLNPVSSRLDEASDLA